MIWYFLSHCHASFSAPTLSFSVSTTKQPLLRFPSTASSYADRVARGLLEYRCEAQQRQADAFATATVAEPKPEPYVVVAATSLKKVVPAVPPTDPVKAEQTARALLTERVQREAAVVAAAKAAAAAQAAQIAAEAARLAAEKEAARRASILAERRQRGILAERLGAQAVAYAKVLEERRAKEEQEALAEKYASIECIEERAFTILSDLGMLQTA